MMPPIQSVAGDTRLPGRVDFVVIGGGIIGVAAAYFLAKKGRSVALIEMARKFQLRNRLLTPAETKALTPGNEQDWIGGIHAPTDGRAEPLLAAPALATAARALGATVLQDCAVRGLDIVGGRVAGVVTERGRIAADRVLCAGGAWASMFCRRHDIDLPQAGIRS